MPRCRPISSSARFAAAGLCRNRGDPHPFGDQFREKLMAGSQRHGRVQRFHKPILLLIYVKYQAISSTEHAAALLEYRAAFESVRPTDRLGRLGDFDQLD